jgi:hypothetical protein
LGLDEKPAKAKKAKANGEKLLFVEKYAPVWDALPDGMDTQVCVGEKAPRGIRQTEVIDFIKSRGRKKTTAKMVLDGLEDVFNINGIFSHMINQGTVGIVE